MKSKTRVKAFGVGLAIAGLVGVAAGVLAQPARGPRPQGGMCGGGHGADMMEIHALFASRNQIRRTVTPIPGGVRATTESDDPAVVTRLRAHVQAMYARLRDKRPINARDPLFAAIFENADKIHVEMQDTPKGMTVIETSEDPAVVSLVRRHADVVSLFLQNGMPEMMRSH